MTRKLFDETYPRQLADEEAGSIETRRRAAGPKSKDDPRWKQADPDKHPLPPDTVGVALSGGGIRSATFCLGVFRALARMDLLRRIDFISTVSGGGYFGSFLGGLYVPRPLRKECSPNGQDVERVRGALLDSRSWPIDWLRENGRYLSPNGAGDALLAGAALVRNWVAVIVVVTSTLFTLFAAAAWLAQPLARGLATLGEWPPPLTWLGQMLEVGQATSATAGPAYALAVSPYAVLPMVCLVFAVALGWAYWFTQPFGFSLRRAVIPPFFFAAALLAATLVLDWSPGWRGLLGAVAALALLFWAVTSSGRLNRGDEEGRRRTRNRLSRCLSVTLWTTVGLLVFVLLDTIGLKLAGSQQPLVWKTALSIGAGLLGALGIAQRVLPLLAAFGRGTRLSPRPQALAGVAALLVGSTLFVGLSAAAHAIAPDRLWYFVAAGVLVTLASARTMPFLNLSSHNSLYGQRLTRAYLGASNENRRNQHSTVTELREGDSISLDSYDPAARGGPLHLINVTLNETVSGKSQLEQRDRKGLPMSVGTCGISVGRRDHALWVDGRRGRKLRAVSTAEGESDFQIFPKDGFVEPEQLDLGDWTSISGAAFTPGLGARTSLSLSVLLGLANVRLGYWWDCGVSPGSRPPKSRIPETRMAWIGRLLTAVAPVHAHLCDELLARFHGPARRHWYLSDGGHSENTGAYELIRRRVPFIVICDNGCDPGYEFADLANLARRVRVDLGAELAFFAKDQLRNVLPGELLSYFGTIEDFDPKRQQDRLDPSPHALLAGVFYEDPLREKREPDSMILVLKPSLSGDEPLDVRQYRAEHGAFPQEPTADQFFDEAQWESYRRLGEHIASRVFDDIGGPWQPLEFALPCAEVLKHLRWPGASRKIVAAPVVQEEALV
jgi:hypothetical protein